MWSLYYPHLMPGATPPLPEPFTLPDELWILVFLKLDPRSLRTLRGVCRCFRTILEVRSQAPQQTESN